MIAIGTSDMSKNHAAKRPANPIPENFLNKLIVRVAEFYTEESISGRYEDDPLLHPLIIQKKHKIFSVFL